MMLIDCWIVVVMWVTGSKYLECYYSIRTEKILNIWTLNNWTKTLIRTKEKQNSQKLNNKLAINNIGTEWLTVSRKGWIVTIKYLQGLNIFVITELTSATLFCLCICSWSISNRAAEFHFLPAGSLMALWKIHGNP